MNLLLIEAIAYVLMILMGMYILRNKENIYDTLYGSPGSLRRKLLKAKNLGTEFMMPGFNEFTQKLAKPLTVLTGVMLIVIGTSRLIVVIVS